jgi:hypothetical protein
MNFNFHEFSKPRLRRLFIPRSAFSFAAFLVPIKFRQPNPGAAGLFSPQSRNLPGHSFGGRMARLDGPMN